MSTKKREFSDADKGPTVHFGTPGKPTTVRVVEVDEYEYDPEDPANYETPPLKVSFLEGVKIK